MQRQRIEWLDSIRGLAFLMVIYSHLPMKNMDVMIFFAPVFLTSFFFVSGYLFKEGDSFSKVVEQRTRTLLIPFLILGIILIGMGQVFSFNEHIPLADAIKGLLYQDGENTILWFIGALYIFSLIFYWIDRFTASDRNLLITVSILFILNCLSLYKWRIGSLPWHIGEAGCACFYMALGKLYRHYETQIDRIMSGWKIIVAIIIYAAYIYWSKLYIGHYGSDAIIDAMVITVAGLMIMITISKKYLHSSRLLIFVGANSLFYFAFHGKVYSLLLAILHKGIPSYQQGEQIWLDATIAVLIVLFDAMILILPAKAVNRWIPQLLGKNYKLWKQIR